jgi:ubiquinone/menaquinone biosynthesis C-methylase UbiE
VYIIARSLVHRSLVLATVAMLALTAQPAWAQLGGRPAADWIPTLDSPGRVAAIKVPELIAALKILPGQTVADVGAGSGVLTGPLAEATGPNGIVYASDIEAGLLAHIDQRMQADGHGHVRTVLGTFDDPALPAPVDLALLNDVLHHVRDRTTFLTNLAGSIKPGGRLALIDYTAEGSPHRGQPDLIVTEAQADTWLREAGLARSETVPLYADRYFVIYTRP